MKIYRRSKKDLPDHPADTRYVYLKFGDRLVDPRTCPIGQHSAWHWELAESEFLPGEPNTKCKCEEPIAEPVPSLVA